jgi:hypothetical protein
VFRGGYGRTNSPSICQTVTPYRLALRIVIVTSAVIRMTAIAKATRKPAFSTFLRLVYDIWASLRAQPQVSKNRDDVRNQAAGPPGRAPDNTPADGRLLPTNFGCISTWASKRPPALNSLREAGGITPRLQAPAACRGHGCVANSAQRRPGTSCGGRVGGKGCRRAGLAKLARAPLARSGQGALRPEPPGCAQRVGLSALPIWRATA